LRGTTAGYVGFLILMLSHIGFWPAMAGALTLYMALIGLIKLAIR
jgi:hypothetical protein